MSTLRTSYDFTLPRGYVDDQGNVHRTGTMRLATARDELEPLRDVTVSGPDDPRLTILVITRVVTSLGDLELITSRDIEGLFAVDLAYLQDFYGVINFGNQAEFEALVAAQARTDLVGSQPTAGAPSGAPAPAGPAPDAVQDPGAGEGAGTPAAEPTLEDAPRPQMRHAVEELPRRNG